MATKDSNVEKETQMGKLNTCDALFIMHIQLFKIRFFFNQLIIIINQKPLNFKVVFHVLILHTIDT
jgi:hypothetical protein